MPITKLTDLESVKEFLDIKQNTSDKLLNALIDSASAFLLSAMDREKGLDFPYKYCKRVYKEVPHDVKLACIELVALRYNQRKRLDEKSQQLAGQVVYFSLAEISTFGQKVINYYRRVTPCSDHA